MIVLLSIGLERTTDKVTNWFLYKNHEFVRINIDELKDNEKHKIFYDLINDCYIFEYKGVKYDLKQRKIVWTRRIGTRSKIGEYFENMNYDDIRELSKHVFTEWEYFLSIFLTNLSKNTKWIDNPKKIHVNKIHVQRLAQKLGLENPITIITNDKKYVKNFLNGKHITKPIEEPATFFYNYKIYTTYTSVLTNFSNNFLPSLIQEKVNKDFEIRSFFWDNIFYSMAIFSQNDKQTEIDFRVYNNNKPNRTIPYKLPLSIEDKLRKLMSALNLTTGSVDIIKSKNGRYYFLEVNPVGQFGMVSKPCNYNLEYLVYETLARHEKNL